MKKVNNKVLVVLIVSLLLSGCTTDQGTDGSSSEMGRYMERQIELPVSDKNFVGLAQNGLSVRLIEKDGADLFSEDGGISFESVSDMSEVVYDLDDIGSSVNTAVTLDGARLFSKYVSYKKYEHVLITSDGKVIPLKNLDEANFLCPVFGGDGNFYASLGRQIYRVNPENGECSFLFDTQDLPSSIAADNNRLYASDVDGIIIYDLRKKEKLDQDKVLDEFYTEEYLESQVSSHSFLICPSEDGVYVLTHAGLYYHTLYGESMEIIIDGALNGIGEITRNFVGMAAFAEGEHMAFLIYYSDGSLMSYIYDSTISAVPEKTLRIYSVYEDGNVRQAASGFQKLHPELYVKYEVGLKADSGMTLDDAWKNLSTELAAGNGPDILLMDDIPYEAYVEKGVLMDLSHFRTEMTELEYFTNVIDEFYLENGLYTIPLTFSIPVLGGKQGELDKAESLADLADLLEIARENKADGSIFSFYTAREAIQLLAQSSYGAWMDEDMTLDREAVTEFLVQAKRIHDAQVEGLTSEEKTGVYKYSGNSKNGRNVLTNHFQSQGALSAISSMVSREQPYFAGFLGDAIDEYPEFLAWLKETESEYTMMPGQKYGTCLPATLLSINNASRRKEEAEQFLEYILSGEFQGNAFINGIPIGKTGYFMRQICPRPTGGLYGGTGTNLMDGTFLLVEIYWPTPKEWEDFDTLVDGVAGVNRCDKRIYEAVIELGEPALTGESGIEEAVDAIEKRVQLYLAE